MHNRLFAPYDITRRAEKTWVIVTDANAHGLILQLGNTIKVKIELPVAIRHRRDMSQKFLKATHVKPEQTTTIRISIFYNFNNKLLKKGYMEREGVGVQTRPFFNNKQVNIF